MNTDELEAIKEDIENIKSSIEAIKGAILCLHQGPYMRAGKFDEFIKKISIKPTNREE